MLDDFDDNILDLNNDEDLEPLDIIGCKDRHKIILLKEHTPGEEADLLDGVSQSNFDLLIESNLVNAVKHLSVDELLISNWNAQVK